MNSTVPADLPEEENGGSAECMAERKQLPPLGAAPSDTWLEQPAQPSHSQRPACSHHPPTPAARPPVLGQLAQAHGGALQRGPQLWSDKGGGRLFENLLVTSLHTHTNAQGKRGRRPSA